MLLPFFMYVGRWLSPTVKFLSVIAKPVRTLVVAISFESSTRHCEGVCARGNPYPLLQLRCHHPYGMGHLPMDSPPA